MNELKEFVQNKFEEIKRHFSVLKEDFDRKINLLAEGQKAIREKLDRHEEIMNGHGEMLKNHGVILNRHGEMLKNHGVMLKKHGEILDSHTQMMGKIQSDIEIIKNDIELIKNSLKKKVDLEDFEALEKRVRILESKIR